jgi:hypothetical protein
MSANGGSIQQQSDQEPAVKRNTAPMLLASDVARRPARAAPATPRLYGGRGAAGCTEGRRGQAPRHKNALKLGLYTREAIAERKALRNLLRQSRKLMMRFVTQLENSQDP